MSPKATWSERLGVQSSDREVVKFQDEGIEEVLLFNGGVNSKGIMGTLPLPHSLLLPHSKKGGVAINSTVLLNFTADPTEAIPLRLGLEAGRKAESPNKLFLFLN